MYRLKPIEEISRRSLIKLMLLAGPIICGPTPLLAETVFSPTNNRDAARYRTARRPRLFYNSASLHHFRRWLASDAAASDALQKRGEELLAADFIPESTAMKGPGQQQNFGAP